jgi:predicted small lipoprotein YifL
MIFLKQAILAAIIVSTLAGCGVKGDPEAPKVNLTSQT